MMKTYMKARPTTSMKKGWLVELPMTSRIEIEQVMIQTWWWSSDAPDQVMIQTWWWSSDAPDQVMIQTRWWSSDAPNQVIIQTWWRWLDDDPYDTEKKTCADKLCRENIFLVKRECWCNCNFRMYSLMYLMYCTPMIIPECVCNVIKSCHAPMFRSRFSIM